jgi:hypothetical protein
MRFSRLRSRRPLWELLGFAQLQLAYYRLLSTRTNTGTTGAPCNPFATKELTAIGVTKVL